jgi:hypothetical protein
VVIDQKRALQESDESLILLDESYFKVYITPSLESKDYLLESNNMDKINISSWSASFEPSSSIIYFSLQFTNFAYISQSLDSDLVIIDFMEPEKINAKKSGVILEPDRLQVSKRIVKQMP